MHDLAQQIWRLEKTVILALTPQAAPDSPLDSLGEALLEYVRDAPRPTPTQIARNLAVTKPAITKRLRAATAAGLITLTPDTRDARRLVVELTAQGVARLAQQEELRSINAARYTQGWDPRDQERLIALFARLNDAIDEQHHRDMPGWAHATMTGSCAHPTR